MVISDEQKKVLLERLKLAKEAKAKKAAERKKAAALAEVKEPEPPKPVPPPVVETTPEPVVEKAPETIPPVPDLVAMSKKAPKKSKKQCFVPSDSDSDSDEEEEIALPKKIKKGGKKTPYLKLKIYREPKNAAAFQQLIEAVQEPEEEPEETRPPASEPINIPKPTIRYANANANNPAMKKGAGVVSHQEALRRMALEYFG